MHNWLTLIKDKTDSVANLRDNLKAANGHFCRKQANFGFVGNTE